MKIRAARPGDSAAIRAVHEAAFETPLEADLVEALEAEGDAVISLVAERSGVVAGHVLLSRMGVDGDGHDYQALGLGPVGVLPSLQGEGIGAALIGRAVEIARDGGEELIFLLGEPAYYQRFGFSVRTAAPFASPYAGPYFMALALRQDVALPPAGDARYPPAFARLGGAA